MAQVSVTLVRADTNQEYDVELPDDAVVSELLPALVKQLGLPLTGPDGNQVAYEISNKRTGREFKETDTLGGAGTKTGDNILLTSTFVAGGALNCAPTVYDEENISEFWEAVDGGARVEVTEGLYWYFLEVLPPRFMYRVVTLADGSRQRADFGFAEGDTVPTAFWLRGGKSYAQRVGA